MSVLTGVLAVRWKTRFEDDPLLVVACLPIPFLSDAELLRLTRSERQRFTDLALRTVDTMPTMTVLDELARDRLMATACAAGF